MIGAEYHEVGAKDSIPLCPLALLDTDNGLQWLAGWFERLLFRRKAFELDESDSKALLNGLQDIRMYKNSSPDDVKHGRGRNLLDLYAAISGGTEGRNRIRKILDEVMSYYPHILCGNPSDLGKSRVTVYQLSSLNGVPKYISTPTKELILHNIIVSLDGSPTWVIWDEFWDAVGDDTSAQWLFESLRLMRGINCSFGGMTQSSTDITQSPHCNVLLGNMPGLLFFPDASAATPYIAESLYQMGLNPHEVSRIASALPGQFFYRSSLGARLADARLGHMGQAICAATSHQDVTLARQILQQCGDRTEFLAAWLAARGLSIAPEAQALNGRGVGTGQAHHNGNGIVVPVRRHEVQP